MNKLDVRSSESELLNMMQAAEDLAKKEKTNDKPNVMMVEGEKTHKLKHKGMNFKKKSKGNKSFRKAQGGYAYINMEKNKSKVRCFHCGKMGH